MSRGPVLIAARDRLGPEPEVEFTGVAQAQPDVSGRGVLRPLGHSVLEEPAGDLEQVGVVRPAVAHGFHPRQVFPNQNDAS